jgi:thiamine-monophosphate kinase
VNLSDLAAKGAEPIGVLIGASLIEGSERFVEGLRHVLTEYGVPLLGGDTVAPAPGSGAMFGCTAIGRATHRPVPARSGARPGDALWVAGTIGGAMLAFGAVQRREPRAPWHRAYLRPVPLLAEGRTLARHVHAMMDVSDGLLLDARRMAEASGCTIDIALDAIPFAAPLADAAREERIAAAGWGDDYALLFAAPATLASPVPVSRIGTVLGQGTAPLLLDGATPPARLGYEHR